MSLQFIVKYALSLDIQFKMAAPFEKSKLFFNYKFLQKTLISLKGLKSLKVCKFLTGKKGEVWGLWGKTLRLANLGATCHFFETRFLTQNSSKKAEFVFIEMFRKAIDWKLNGILRNYVDIRNTFFDIRIRE